MFTIMQPGKRSILAVTVSAASMGIAISEVRAQDALGSGNALDRNTRIGSGGVNSALPPNPYAGRNAVVTGEVVGGREFRGRVGYTAPGDFRGATGSDELFRFRADSAWSNPAVITLGTTTYDQLRFGQGLGVIELQRASTAATPLRVQQVPKPVSFSELAESRMRYDNVALSTLSATRMQNAADPTTLALARSTEGESVALTASPVRGLTIDRFNPQWSALGLSEYDQMRAREEGGFEPGPADEAGPQALPGEAGGVKPVPSKPGTTDQRGRKPGEKEGEASSPNKVGAEFETRFENLRTDPRVETGVNDEHRVQGEAQTDYAQVLQRIVDRYAHGEGSNAKIDPALLRKMDEQYQTLRDKLASKAAAGQPQIDPRTGRPITKPTGAPIQSATPGSIESSTHPGRPTQQETGKPSTTANPPDRETNPPKRGSDETGVPATPDTSKNPDVLADIGKSKEPERKPIDVSEIGDALRHGQKVERLSSEEQGRLNELMVAAEEQLRKGEYMAAEERFQRALRFSPGHPMAMAGAANAQLGAGFYLSSALTLRRLFSDHPEMIDTTYVGGLLPDASRLEAAVKALRSRMEAPADRASFALLLAYIGRQTTDRAMMDEGLKVMEKEAADDPLPPVLRSIWLSEPEKQKPSTPESPATPEK